MVGDTGNGSITEGKVCGSSWLPRFGCPGIAPPAHRPRHSPSPRDSRTIPAALAPGPGDAATAGGPAAAEATFPHLRSGRAPVTRGTAAAVPESDDTGLRHQRAPASQLDAVRLGGRSTRLVLCEYPLPPEGASSQASRPGGRLFLASWGGGGGMLTAWESVSHDTEILLSHARWGTRCHGIGFLMPVLLNSKLPHLSTLNS